MNLLNEYETIICKDIFNGTLNWYIQWIYSMDIFNGYIQWVYSMGIFNGYIQWVYSMDISNEYMPRMLKYTRCSMIYRMKLQ